MKPSEQKKIPAYLSDMYEKFLQCYREQDGAWGQFIDSPVSHDQIGRYGTSSGAIIIGLSGNGSGKNAQNVTRRLAKWLDNTDAANKKHLAQLISKAIIMLGLSKLGTNEAIEHASRLFNELLSSRTPANLWGDYWEGPHNYDEQSSLFASSFILVCLCLASEENVGSSEICSSASEIESLYLSDPPRHKSYAPLVFAAISLSGKNKISSTLKSYIRSYAYEPIDLAKKHTYFYDYRYGDSSWGREYLILPIELMNILAINNPVMPISYRLRASKAVALLKSNIDENSGLFKSDVSNRISTLEQGLCALSLQESGERYRKNNSNLKNLLCLGGEVFFFFRRSRPEPNKYVNMIYLAAYFELVIMLLCQVSYGYTMTDMKEWVLKASIFILASLRNPAEIIRSLVGRKP